MKRMLPSLALGSVLFGMAAFGPMAGSRAAPLMEDPFAGLADAREDAIRQISIPEEFRGMKGIAVQVTDGPEAMACIVVNGTDGSIWFDGFGISEPFYEVELMKDGKWTKRDAFRCGTGLRKSELKPRHAVRFHAHYYNQEIVTPIRVGIHYQDQRADQNFKSAWSEAITPRRLPSVDRSEVEMPVPVAPDPFLQPRNSKQVTERNTRAQIAIPETLHGSETLALRQVEQDGDFLRMMMVNGSGKSMIFTGYGIHSPFYRMEIRKDGQWVEHPLLWYPGPGFHHPELIAKHAAYFNVNLPHAAGSTVRVGIDFEELREPDAPSYEPPATVWSDPVVVTEKKK